MQPVHGSADTKLRALKMVLPLVYAGVLVLPAYVFFSVRGGAGFLAGSDLSTFSARVFPLVGLYAFTLVWFQFMLGSSLGPLRRVFPGVRTFHQWEGGFALLFALAHPTLLLIGVGLPHYLARDFVAPNLVPFIWVGYVQLTLIMLTAGTALLRKIPWLQPRWHYIHYANYLVFVLVWVHSWFLGSDVRTTGLKYLWFFFAATAVVSGVGRLVRKLRKRAAAGVSGDHFIAVARADQVPDRQPVCVSASGHAIALFKVRGAFYALANVCPHAGGSLCEGQIEGSTVICPLHGSRFDVTSGALLRGPATAPQKTYPVRVANGEVQIGVPA